MISVLFLVARCLQSVVVKDYYQQFKIDPKIASYITTKNHQSISSLHIELKFITKFEEEMLSKVQHLKHFQEHIGIILSYIQHVSILNYKSIGLSSNLKLAIPVVKNTHTTISKSLLQSVIAKENEIDILLELKVDDYEEKVLYKLDLQQYQHLYSENLDNIKILNMYKAILNDSINVFINDLENKIHVQESEINTHIQDLEYTNNFELLQLFSIVKTKLNELKELKEKLQSSSKFIYFDFDLLRKVYLNPEYTKIDYKSHYNLAYTINLKDLKDLIVCGLNTLKSDLMLYNRLITHYKKARMEDFPVNKALEELIVYSTDMKVIKSKISQEVRNINQQFDFIISKTSN